MAANEGALRQRVEQAQAKLADARAKYDADPSDATGRQLVHWRGKASEALADLYAATPNAKPPTQRVM